MRENMFRAMIIAISAVIFLSAPAAGSAQHASYPRAELDENNKRASVSGGGVTARLSAEPQIVDGATEIVPYLEVLVGGKVVAHARGVSAGPDFLQGVAEIVELDRANKTPEIVFSSYSGGAHCCTRVIVVGMDGKGHWRAKTVGDWDGGGDYIEDADGDGVAELVVIDNAFLYAFDCYACSAAPLKVLSIDKGEIVDVTRDTRFPGKAPEMASRDGILGKRPKGRIRTGLLCRLGRAEGVTRRRRGSLETYDGRL